MEGFDVERFGKTQFKHREGTVPVPGFAAWFTKGSPAEFKVRGLDGTEYVRVQEAEGQSQNWLAMLEGITGDSLPEKVKVFKELLGRTGDKPGELIRRIEAVEIGLVEPKMDRGGIVKLADTYPVEFQKNFLEIIRLTGLGQDPGKQPGSGETPPSEPPSPSGKKTASVSSKSSRTSSRKKPRPA